MITPTAVAAPGDAPQRPDLRSSRFTAERIGGPDGGDDPEIVELILAEREYLRRLALSFARHAPDADDLVQETFIRALRARRQFAPGSCMRAWLSTILRHVFLAGVQARGRRLTRPWTDSGIGERALELPAPPAEHGTDRCDFDSVAEHLDAPLHRALRRLPAPYRDTLCLFALGGLTYPEIARRMGIPKGTVMSRLHRARWRLRCVLGPAFERMFSVGRRSPPAGARRAAAARDRFPRLSMPCGRFAEVATSA